MTTPTADVGDCYEYDKAGRRQPGTDRLTIDTMVRLSKKWPDLYHQYVGPNGYVTWAKNGVEIADPFARYDGDLPRYVVVGRR